MIDKLKNIDDLDCELNSNGEFTLSSELATAIDEELALSISGGFDPEEDEYEEQTNGICLVIRF